MRKISFLFALILISALAVSVWAANSKQVSSQNNPDQQSEIQTISPIISKEQVQEQNQVKIKNQGEEQQIQTQNQEQENLETGEGLQTRNQNALEHMSNVAKQVQLLLQTRTSDGIGEQVKEIAQQQNQAQEQIQQQVNKLNSKSKLAKLLTGTDFQAVKNLRQQLEQNQLRITQLEQLENQVSNQGDKTAVQEAVQALIEQNTSLQEMIAAEEQTKSLFGWLFKLFLR